MPSVSYQPTREDVLAALRLSHFANVTGRRAAAFLVAYTVGAFALVRYSDGPWDVAAVFAGGAGLVVVVILGIAHLVRPRYVASRQFREQRNLHETYTLEWSDTGFAARGPTTASDMPWDHFTRWREDGRVILLYHSRYQFQFVPKRILPPGGWEAIQAHLRQAGVPRARRFLS